jgi:hypothetical protein
MASLVAQPPAALVLVAWMWGAAAACSKPATTAMMDAAAPTEDASRTCPSARVCDGTRVVECRGGALVVQDCAPALVCSLGRCTSVACQAEEAKLASSLLGCTFYTLEVDNVASESAATSSVLVTNPGDTPATVELRARNASDGAWEMVAHDVVLPLQATRLALPMKASTGEAGLAVGAALQLASDQPVSAAHVQSDDMNEIATNSGGTLLLPAHVLGQHYMAVTYPQVAKPKLIEIEGARRGAGQVIIVGTEDGTKVHFKLPATARLDPTGGGPTLDVLQAFDLTLDDGDVYQIFSVAEGDDLTGSLIDANHPVAVFSGNMATTYGYEAPGINSPDMAHEQLLPIKLWGTEYVGALLPPTPDTCDGILGAPDAALYRIVALEEGTMIHLEAPAGVTGLPASDVVLGAGQTHTMTVSGGSFRAISTKPFLLTQGMDCEPTLSSAVPTKSLLTDLWFAVLPHFDQMVAMVRRAGEDVFLDDIPIAASSFQPAGEGFEVATISLPACPKVEGACAHHLAGQFGMSLRGMDVRSSYELTAPTWVCDVGMAGCLD